MGSDLYERLKRQMEDEDLFTAIKKGDYRTALTEILKQVRGVTICEHDNITTYQPCPQCDEELDRLVGCDDEDDPEPQIEVRRGSCGPAAKITDPIPASSRRKVGQ